MASKAHCIYCFETLTARLEKRTALSLQEADLLWSRYYTQYKEHSEPADVEMTEDSEQVSAEEEDVEEEPTHQHNLRHRQISKIQNSSSASSSNVSTPSNSSSQTLSSEASKTSSKSSLFSFLTISPMHKDEEYPLFVTWNTTSGRDHKSLRGCIGTFDAQQLSRGLREYALTSAFNDVRFSPISMSELPTLSCDVTLLLNFTQCKDPLDWQIGTHGLRISFTYHNRRYGSTYLPQVAPEQGWTKEETLVSLMRKAGWSGRSSEWRKVTDLKCIRYEGKKADVDYATYKSWREWVDTEAREGQQ